MPYAHTHVTHTSTHMQRTHTHTHTHSLSLTGISPRTKILFSLMITDWSPSSKYCIVFLSVWASLGVDAAAKVEDTPSDAEAGLGGCGDSDRDFFIGRRNAMRVDPAREVSSPRRVVVEP